MAMTTFQGSNLAVAGASCALSMWDLVEEKRYSYHVLDSPHSRATAICQVPLFATPRQLLRMPLTRCIRLMEQTLVSHHALSLARLTALFSFMMFASVAVPPG
jgi:hypothetical protein